MLRTLPQIAKLTRPRLHKAAVRERLFRRLDEARVRHPAICVVGPPGAGKTTLVANWLDARGFKGIWYQVDPGDADLASFFYYLALAAKPYSRKGQRPLPTLTPEYLHDVAGFARRFFRELFARIPVPATVILDNYQEVEAAGVNLIPVSRRDPPDCYARLIANENVAFVEYDDLKLTFPEAQAIAAQRGRDDPELVRLLHARTEGWAAGMTLMLERAQGADLESECSFHTHQAIFDYFAAQIFGRVSDEVRAFLMATAWLPSVRASVAAVLTGNPNAQSILDDLHRRHLFVHRRPGELPSYQYHALFRDFLRARAQATMDGQTLAALKRTAAKLLEDTGDGEAAIELYREGAAWVDCIRLIVSHAPQLLAHGRWKTLQECASRLPANEVEDAPWLGYWLARSKLGPAPGAARDELRRVLARMEQRADVMGQILCVAAIMESHWVEWSGLEELDGWIDRALRLLTSNPAFPSQDSEIRVMSMLLLATALRQPRHPVFVQAQERLMALIATDLPDDIKVFAGSVLLGNCAPTGDLKAGAWIVARVDPIAQRATVSAVARLMWLLRFACLHARRADYDLMWQTLGQAEALLAEEGLRVGLAMMYWWGAHFAILTGDLANAEAYALKLQTATALGRPFHRGLLLNIRCMAALAGDDYERALELGREATAITKSEGVVWTTVWFIVPTIYAMLETGRYAEAAVHIDALRDFIAGTFVDAFEAELLLAQAYLAHKTGQLSEYRSLLREALRIAKEREYVYPFRSAFHAHRVLIADAFRQDQGDDYLCRTVRQFKLRPDQAADERWPWRIRVFTLGRFQIQVDDKAVTFGRKTPRKPIALLKACIALGGHAVPERRLLDAIWPDEEGDAARHSFLAALHRLRSLLGARESLIYEDGSLTLSRSLCWVDALHLDAVLSGATGQGADAGGTPRASAWESVARLYHGAFLPEEDAPWVLPFRERLSTRLMHCVLATARALEAQCRWDEAIGWYQRGLDADPLTESFYQGLMRCYLQSGRSTEGLSAYRRMRQLLSVSLGIAPSSASQALYQALQAPR